VTSTSPYDDTSDRSRCPRELDGLLIEEVGSDKAELIWDSADTLGSASLVTVEARAALAAAARDDRLTAAQLRRAKAELALLIDQLATIEITATLVEDAAHLAELEALRGYDAVHLAAALTIGADVLSSGDTALCEAASRRGLHVANPLE